MEQQTPAAGVKTCWPGHWGKLIFTVSIDVGAIKDNLVTLLHKMHQYNILIFKLINWQESSLFTSDSQDPDNVLSELKI